MVGWHRGEAKSCFVVLHFALGDLAAKDWELMETPMEEGEGEILSALLRQYYVNRSHLPKQILLPCELEDEVAVTQLRTPCRAFDAPAGSQDGPYQAGE